MDGDVSQEDFTACLRDLATVNTVTRARGPTLGFVRRALRQVPVGSALLIVDVGFGAGDMLRAIARMLRRSGRHARLVGIDLNPRSEPVAEALTDPGAGIVYHTGDVFTFPFGQRPDLIISSLVTHHMTDAEVVRFLGWMERTATLGWFVNDLHRHPVPYHGFTAMAALARWHRFVRHDGPLSIARSFRRAEWKALLHQADVEDARISWHFPFRLCIERRRW